MTRRVAWLRHRGSPTPAETMVRIRGSARSEAFDRPSGPSHARSASKKGRLRLIDRTWVERLERAALWAWPPKETAHVEGWLLRASGGATRRVNSAQTLMFASGADLERALARVEGWYRARALPPCFQLTDLAAPAGLDAALEARGYARLPSVSVFLIEASRVEPPAGPSIELLTRPTPLVMNAVCDPRWVPAARRVRAELFARIRRPHTFAVLTEGGQPVAGGLCVVEKDLAGVFTLRTTSSHRRRGHARAVLRRLVAWARGHGAHQIYAQVEDDNTPALAVYRPYEAQRVYGYWYRERPEVG